MTFTRRPLSGPDTLGERFRQLREERHLSLEQISKAIDVPAKYLAAIESSQYEQLPGLVYARNFVRKYAAFVSLPEAAVLEKFEQEFQVISGRRSESPRLVQRANTEFPWYIRHGRFLIAAVVIFIVGGYLIAQVVHLIRPPMLEVIAPATDISTTATTIVVSGRTEAGVEVKINNQQTDVASDGVFTDRIDLQLGLNELKVTASRKYSQPAVVIRRVLLEK